MNNVKNAMGDRDTGAWGWTLGEWLKHTVKVEQRVEELEAERDKYKKTLAHIALGTLEGGGSNHSSVHDSVGMADFSLGYPSTKELREMLP